MHGLVQPTFWHVTGQTFVIEVVQSPGSPFGPSGHSAPMREAIWRSPQEITLQVLAAMEAQGTLRCGKRVDSAIQPASPTLAAMPSPQLSHGSSWTSAGVSPTRFCDTGHGSPPHGSVEL